MLKEARRQVLLDLSTSHACEPPDRSEWRLGSDGTLREPFDRQPDIVSRILHGVVGAFLGVLLVGASALYFDEHAVVAVVAASAVCFILAFIFGGKVLHWISEIIWWT